MDLEEDIRKLLAKPGLSDQDFDRLIDLLLAEETSIDPKLFERLSDLGIFEKTTKNEIRSILRNQELTLRAQENLAQTLIFQELYGFLSELIANSVFSIQAFLNLEISDMGIKNLTGDFFYTLDKKDLVDFSIAYSASSDIIAEELFDLWDQFRGEFWDLVDIDLIKRLYLKHPEVFRGEDFYRDFLEILILLDEPDF